MTEDLNFYLILLIEIEIEIASTGPVATDLKAELPVSGPVPAQGRLLHLFIMRSECPIQTCLADVSFFPLFKKSKG